MVANNETGVIQPVAEVARVARAHGALIHSDGVQALGKMDFAFSALDADMMTVSAHKIGGPSGVGALIKRAGIDLQPLSLGGGQEDMARRPGTENLAGIAGFGAAAKVARGLDVTALRDRLEREVLAAVPGARIFGAGALRVGNTSCIGLPDVKAETQVMALDLAGVSIGGGCCLLVRQGPAEPGADRHGRK